MILNKVDKLQFQTFHHPYACRFLEEASAGSDLTSLLLTSTQSLSRDQTHLIPRTLFEATYQPSEVVASGSAFPRYDVDFSLGGAYSEYNWELFFHIPMLIASRLAQDERHEEAIRWLQFIFNPTTDSKDSAPKRFWLFKPLRDLGKPETIKNLLQSLKPEGRGGGEFEADVKDWRPHAFEPYRIARRRWGAFQKNVVMKYLEYLIAQGDRSFRSDTIESINEATQLYVLAGRLLGPRPIRVPALESPPAQTYADLRPGLDALSNAVVWIEARSIPPPFSPAVVRGVSGRGTSILGASSLYFCIPRDEKLLAYWDIVADRLFKIRHCMNIEGTVRELPLFEPPIDPALLVRAKAMGLDFASVLDDMRAPAPHYRFSFVLQKAREFCEELKQLGGLLLSVLEKRDAEKLAQLRAGHEKALLKAMRDVKKQQIKEAESTVRGLEQAREQASLKQQFYSSRPFMIEGEALQLELLAVSTTLQAAGQGYQLGASVAHAEPDYFDGALVGGQSSGRVYLYRMGGGSPAGSALQAAGRAMEILAGIAQAAGAASGILAGYQRRADDWKLQADLAGKEIKQLDRQILAAEIRRQIADRDLSNHELQIEQSEQIEESLREKFTNEDLYGWMQGQISAVYFQAYRLAYDMAKKAERAYRMDLGIEDSSIVQFGAWDSLRKGLLAGERLSLDLRRLEASYLDQNRRTYELTKHVSLAQLDPLKLILLRETGTCDEVHVPEALFDLDYPGHYMRRIKSVSITIPCVTGPYTGVGCTLTLLKHRTRTKPQLGEVEPVFGPVQSIATSTGRNDAGLFELNFRDERLFPFEGAGAESWWRIELPTKVRQFDYQTIPDVILHISYTAIDAGASFKKEVEGALEAQLNAIAGQDAGLFRLFSIRHEFSNEWSRLQQGEGVQLTIGPDRLPYFASVMDIPSLRPVWFAKMKPGAGAPTMTVSETPVDWFSYPNIPDLWTTSGPEPSTEPPDIPLASPFTLKTGDPGNMKALLLLVTYKAKISP